VNAAQVKELKQIIRSAADDLAYVIMPLLEEATSAPNRMEDEYMRSGVQRVAQRHLWLAVSDHAFRDFGLDLPVYAKAKGTRARQLVDAAAGRFGQRLAKAE
jgi:hypothetical protein